MGTSVPRARGGLLGGTILLGVLVFATIALAAEEPPTPTIIGEPVVGETLLASEGAVHKWQRCDPGEETCGSDGGQNGSGWSNIHLDEGDRSAYTVTEPDLGMMIRVLAKGTNLGTKFAASEAVGPVSAASLGEEPGQPEQPPPPVQQSETPPPKPPGPPREPPRQRPDSPPGQSDPKKEPAFGQSGNLNPIEGTVLVRLPGSKELVPIEDLTQVPMGTKVDVTDGRVELTTERKPAGKLQTTELWGGAFVVTQKLKARVTVLRLSKAFGAAAAHPRSGAQAAARRGKRRLWGRGRCRCRHRGRNSSGTARGTWWVTVERPKGTVTRVRKGIVLVRDFKLGKKVLVRKGQRYLARR